VPDRTLGQVAYETHVRVFGHTERKIPWDQLRPPTRSRWEAIATAVIKAGGGSGG
jgi:hypothetical protein